MRAPLRGDGAESFAVVLGRGFWSEVEADVVLDPVWRVTYYSRIGGVMLKDAESRRVIARIKPTRFEHRGRGAYVVYTEDVFGPVRAVGGGQPRLRGELLNERLDL